MDSIDTEMFRLELNAVFLKYRRELSLLNAIVEDGNSVMHRDNQLFNA